MKFIDYLEKHKLNDLQ